jgi:hypothetical protein
MSELDHARLKALAKELGRPLFSLEVLRNDPFTARVPARKAGPKVCPRRGPSPASVVLKVEQLFARKPESRDAIEQAALDLIAEGRR